MKIKIFILVANLYTLVSATTLSQAYSMALNNNSELKQAFYEGQAALQRTDQARASLLPNINTQISYSLDKYRRKDVKDRIDESYLKYGINLNQQILKVPLWYEKELSKIKEASSQLFYESQKQELAKKLTQAYFDYVYDLQYLKLANSYVQANAARYNQLAKSLSFGLTNKMDTLESKVRLDEANLEVAKAKRKIDISKLALEKLVGEEIEVVNLFTDINIDFFKNLKLDKFENINTNFDYRQSNLSSEFADSEYKKRLSEYMPTLDLNIGFYKHDYIDDSRFFDEKDKIEGMLSFNLPLYSGGATKSRVEEARILKLISIEKQNDTKKDVYIKQRQAKSDFLGYISEYEIAHQSLEHAKLYEESIESGYSQRLKSLVDLLDAKARVFKVENDVLKASYNLITAYLQLYSGIGEITIKTIQDLEHALN